MNPHGWLLEEICHGDWFLNHQTGPFPSREAAKAYAEAETTRAYRDDTPAGRWEDGDNYSAASEGLHQWWVTPITNPEYIPYYDTVLHMDDVA